jgi:hypothetical protein
MRLEVTMDPVGTATTTGFRSTRKRAIALVASAGLVALSMTAGPALANGGPDQRKAENTFTKWVTDFGAGTMAGFVGGDVGDGTYAGQILHLEVSATGAVIDATYHFSGSRHTFTALVRVVQTGFVDGATAVITGRVTEGWLKGNEVNGAYTQIACSEAASGSCFQGTLDILRGSKH